jgi:hypothetical protein
MRSTLSASTRKSTSRLVSIARPMPSSTTKSAVAASATTSGPSCAPGNRFRRMWRYEPSEVPDGRQQAMSKGDKQQFHVMQAVCNTFI